MRILAFMVLATIVSTSIAPFVQPDRSDAQNAQRKLKIKEIDASYGISENKINSYSENFYSPAYIAMGNKKSNKLKHQQIRFANYPSFFKGDFTVNASAYTAAADECGKSDGITASGKKVSENRTLACPPQYSFGTQIEIDGVGTFVCEDRGGAIKGNRVDIYMPTKGKALAFGRRNLTARVVN